MNNNNNAAAGSSNGNTAAESDMIGILGSLLKNQTGEPQSNERLAHLLYTNMNSLVKQGKISQNQIVEVL